jgi:hypothetical protein
VLNWLSKGTLPYLTWRPTCTSASTSSITHQMFIKAKNVQTKGAEENKSYISPQICFFHESFGFWENWINQMLCIHFWISIFSNNHSLPITLIWVSELCVFLPPLAWTIRSTIANYKCNKTLTTLFLNTYWDLVTNFNSQPLNKNSPHF